MNQRRILDQMLDDFRNVCRGFDYRRCGFDPDNLIPKELEDEKPIRDFP